MNCPSFLPLPLGMYCFSVQRVSHKSVIRYHVHDFPQSLIGNRLNNLESVADELDRFVRRANQLCYLFLPISVPLYFLTKLEAVDDVL